MPFRALLGALLLIAACTPPDGRQHVGKVLGLDTLREYRGQQSGFQDTFYHARFVSSPEEVAAVVKRLDLRPARLDDFEERVPVERFFGPSRALDWWDPHRELVGGDLYRQTERAADRPAILAEYTLGFQPETGVAYVVVVYP